MSVAVRKSEEEAIRSLERVNASEIAEAELVVGRREATSGSPFSVRLSEPLLDRLDRLAAKDNRKRGNLIQHILWEYIRAHPIE